MRRVLQAMAGARHGGAETFFVRLVGALHRAGESQRVLIRRNAARARALRDAGISVCELAFGGPLDIATRLAFRREIAASRPDIVLTWMSRATRLCPRGDFVHVGRLGGYYDLKSYGGCDHLIGNTRAIVDYIVAQGWPGERACYLPNFVPEPPRDTRPVTRPALGLPENGLMALALGRLHPNKGFDLLLDAIAAVPEMALCIAGEGPLRLILQRQAARLGLGGRVRFLGWRDDVPALLASADLVVCPSRHEPLGNVIIEAWAAWRPVAAFASDGPASLIRNEVSGLLVPLPDEPGGGVDALAAVLNRLAADGELRARLGRGGREAYEAEFTEAAVVARYRGFFDQIAR
ncbi:MAG: glycosyltransferase [Alphaproteobacteria bacterium]|nr:glycosyltransferase [Alphaproteobacteria bacterium]